MIRKKRVNKLVLMLAALGVGISSCTNGPEQSETLTEFSRDNLDNRQIQQYHFYPSTVRMLSEVLGENELTTGIEEGKVLLSWKAEENGLDGKLDSLTSEIQKEGFELLGSFRNPEGKVEVYIKEGKPNDYAVFFENEERSLIAEILGDVSVKTLQTIGTLDPSALEDFVQVRKPEEEENKSSSDSSSVSTADAPENDSTAVEPKKNQ